MPCRVFSREKTNSYISNNNIDNSHFNKSQNIYSYRIFSRENTVSCSDIIFKKKYNEINKPLNQLNNTSISYNSYLNDVKHCVTYFQLNDICNNSPLNIEQAKTSYICNNNIENKDCNISNKLYPYGLYLCDDDNTSHTVVNTIDVKPSINITNIFDICSTTQYYNELMKSDTIIQINLFISQYNSLGDNITNVQIMSLDDFNNLNMGLTLLLKKYSIYNKTSKSCYIESIISNYKNILKCIYKAFTDKKAFSDLCLTSKKWANDSLILNNIELLKKYIEQLNNNTKLFSITVEAPLMVIKPEYLIYHELYGYPPDGEYNPELLLQITKNFDN